MKTGEEFDLRHGVVVSLFYSSAYEALGLECLVQVPEPTPLGRRLWFNQHRSVSTRWFFCHSRPKLESMSVTSFLCILEQYV